MATAIPEFGRAEAGVEYALRPGGYAVIRDEAGRMAVVSTPVGLALPGGGQEPGEGPEQAAAREVGEECGLRIEVGAVIGVADDGRYYRKRCTYFFAEVVGRCDAVEVDHELRWLPPADAEADLMHGSQRWAVSRARRRG